MGGKDEDGSVNNWPWDDRTFDRMQRDHAAFMDDLQHQSQHMQEDERADHATPTHNSFAGFKRLIDDNFRALTEPLKNFPSNIAELRDRMQRENERRRLEELDISKRWTGSTDSSDHVAMAMQRSTEDEKDAAHTATVELLSKAFESNEHVPAEKIKRLYADPDSEWGELDRLVAPMLSLGGAWFFSPETGDKIPSGSDWRWPSQEPRWLSVNWFKRSPYSPVRIESHPDLGLYGAKWRAAFEDLLNATLDKPMQRIEAGASQATSTFYGPGSIWMLSLQDRGILPPLLPRFWSTCCSTSKTSRMMSLIEDFPWNSREVPWPGERSSHSPQSTLFQDVSELMGEIKSTSITADESELPVSRFLALAERSTEHPLLEHRIEDGLELTRQSPENTTHIDQNRGRPETEQDLYDAFLEVPQSVNSRQIATQSEAAHRPNPIFLTGNERDDLYESCTAMENALNARDVRAAADVLSAWRTMHGSTAEVVNVALELLDSPSLTSEFDSRRTILNEALRRSRIPDTDRCKRPASHLDTKANSEAYELRPDDAARVSQLLMRHERSAIPPISCRDLSVEEKNEAVELVKRNSDVPTQVEAYGTPKDDVSSKPEVLSALKTTHTTRSPDGTVTTKVALQLRYADGSEETTESVHHSREPEEKPPQQSEHEPRKPGWFWT